MHNDWEIHLTELLVDLGAYQYHMDPTKTIDASLNAPKYLMKPAKLAADIIEMEDRDIPCAPALCMKKNLDGTNTPAKFGTEDFQVYKLEESDFENAAEKFPKKGSEKLRNLRNHMITPRTQPIVGDFNNTVPPMFLDYDPNIKNDFKAIIYVACTYTEGSTDLRHPNARGTAYDSRNDPAWHYAHGTGQGRFEVLKMVKLGIKPVSIKTIDTLGATDDDNITITQEYLESQLAYLNGKKSFNGVSARNTHASIPARQRRITSSTNAADNLNAKMRREMSIALSATNKTLLLQIQLANRLNQGRISLVFINFGTGGISSTLRAEGGLFNKIPEPMFEPNVVFFKAIQQHFGLLESPNNAKRRYIDFLEESTSLNFLVFKPRSGRDIIKRPSDAHKKWPSEKDHSKVELERYRCFSEIVDKNSNVGNLIVIKNDKDIPIMDYLVTMQGSPMMTSHFNHIGNVIPHWHQREIFTKVIKINNKTLLSILILQN